MSDLARHSHANFLTPHKTHYVNSRPHGPAADFNGDGVPDLAVSNSGCHLSTPSKTVSVLLGNGDGTFQAAVDYPAGCDSTSVTAADLNGDGSLDLAFANQGGSGVSVLLGNGDGTFQASLTFGVGRGPVSVAVGDFNADGKPDFAVANRGTGDVSVLINNTLR